MREGPDIPAGALLDALFENASVGLAFWDRDPRHLGRRPSEVLPELSPVLEPVFRSVLETGDPLRDVDVEGETPSAPGVTRHWLASYFTVREAGEVVGVSCIVVEVTAERRAAAADAQLHASVDASPIGVAFLDPELRYRRINETVAQMNGRPAASISARLRSRCSGRPRRP